MPRFNILGFQYFTDDNEVLAGGKINFYQPGTTTRKDTFSDSAQTIQNTNPVTLDADGRSPNIFFSGSAKAVLTDADGVIIETLDPVGGMDSQAFEDYNPEATYAKNMVVVGSDGYFYVSLVDGNFANDPTISPSDWKLFTQFIGFESANNGYLWSVDNTEPQKVVAIDPNTVNNLVLISSATASAVATVDFTGFSSAYKEYLILVNQVRPSADADSFMIRTSTNGGSSYDSGASDYRHGQLRANTTSGTSVSDDPDDSAIRPTGTGLTIESDTSGSGLCLIIRMFNPSAAQNTEFNYSGTWTLSTGQYATVQGAGARLSAADVNAIRFSFSAGNIQSGTFSVYGVKS